jgi:hypothetical protein
MRPFLRKHWPFLALLAAGTLVRVIACLAYHPALWYSDSFGYAAIGLDPYPTVVRPAGYPLLLLWPFHGLHNFLIVVIAQHVIGLASGTIVYALLVRRRLRPWVAALASAPVLLSAYEIQIEHFILSDSLFSFLLILTTAVLLWNRSPGWLACVLAGLLLGAGAITRTEGLPLIAAPVVWMLIQRTPWRVRLGQVVLVCAAFALPVVSYAGWFHSAYGQYRLTYSTGAFMAARAESFAECSADAVPSTDRWLCVTDPGKKPDWYLWTHGLPLSKAPGGEFSRSTDQRGTAFALHVFTAQPTGYLLTTWRGVLQSFASEGSPYSDGQASFKFPARTPPTVTPHDAALSVFRYQPHLSTRVSQPWAGILQVYQQAVVLPPTVVGVITFMGLGGVALAWKRRGGPGLLPLLIGMILVVFPPATSGYGSRYELVGVGALCVAAALGSMEIRGFSAEPALAYTRRRLKRLVGLCAVAAVLVAGCAVAAHVKTLQPPTTQTAAIALPPKGAFQRGIDIDAYTYPGQNFGKAAATDVAYARSLHANAVQVSFPFFGPHVTATGATPTPAQLAVLAHLATQAGLRVTLRPLLDEHSIGGFYRGRWQPASLRAWFASYRAFLLPYAAMAQRERVSEIIVGTELARFASSPRWGQLDRVLHTKFSGQLAYSSNWSDLPQGLAGHGGPVSEAVDAYPPLGGNLLRGWERFDTRLPRGTVETEVGVDAVAGAYRKPWLWRWRTATTVNQEVQARWFTAACRAATRKHLGGVYFWSIGLGNPGLQPTLAIQGAWGGAGARAISHCFAQMEHGRLR